ncbi:MAG: site-specific recombinase [Clostridiales bacterium]|nr:site-specific recombinase [Clostridiales bacterium]
MKTVIYARFSSHSQNEQSIEGQLKTCYDYAERNGYQVIGEYIDRAISGTAAENRPEFQRMISDSAKRQFQAVIVYQLDRFARNRYDSATYKARLSKNGVRVLSARENISDDASGILMESVLEGMAEYYSAELSQKIRRGMNLNAEKGLVTGGNVALGYKVEEKQLVLDPETAPIVKRIFEMYLAGNTMAKIIRYLNDNKVETSRGNEYNKNSIRRILTNRRYIGVYTYKDTEVADGVPRIIDDTTFEQEQILMEKNKKAPARAKAVDKSYILTTKLFCGHCKVAMTGISGTSRNGAIHQYYQCVTTRRKGDCNKKSVQKATIEDLVINKIRELLTDSNIGKIALKVSELSQKERNTDVIKRIQKLLKENEVATNNLIKALESGKVVDVIATQIEKRQAERIELENQLAREKMLRPDLTFEQVKYFFDRFKDGDMNSIVYRQTLVDIFVSKIYLYDDKLLILCNAGEQVEIECPINETGSSMGHMVEARGIEPLSEDMASTVSPSAVIVLIFASCISRSQDMQSASFI